MASDVPAVNAAMRILESLAAAAPRAVLPGELVNEHKLNRSTCYNILATLQRGGWAANLGDRAGWTLGPRLVAVADRTKELVNALVRDELDRLSQELGFVAFLTEMNSAGEHLVVAKAERQSGVRVTVGVGDTFPFSAPALMQAMSAWLTPDERERLFAEHDVVAFTERTVVDRTALEEVLAEVRRHGFSRSVQQFHLGQAGVAAPVFDPRGRVTQAVCCLAFSSQLDESNVGDVGKVVRACAERITERTGGVIPEEPA